MKLKITLLLLFIAMETFSQAIITGHVSGEADPLVGANIILKHSKKGTISDFDGNFEIRVAPRDTLVISYLGFTPKEIEIGDQKHIDVSLDGYIALDEVVVMAYASYSCRTTICCRLIGSSMSFQNENEVLTEKLYPNPSKSGRFQLRLIGDYRKVDLLVYNISGQLVKSFYARPNNKLLYMDLSELASGMYIINVNADGKQIATKKAIID